MTNSTPSQPVSLSNLYAVFGEALFLAQSMEVGMRIFYWLDKALPNTPPGKNPRIDFDAEPLPDINVNSLGGFIRQFRREMMEEGGVDPETRNTIRQLEQSADDRNWLVHTFWWERSEARPTLRSVGTIPDSRCFCGVTRPNRTDLDGDDVADLPPRNAGPE